MPKKPANSGKDWTRADVSRLKKEIAQNTPTRVMGLHLKRSPGGRSAEGQRVGSLDEAPEPVALRRQEEAVRRIEVQDEKEQSSL
jgi:hypothetical protein